MHRLVVDPANGTILAIDPPLNERGQPVTPEGIYTVVREITDTQYKKWSDAIAAKLNATFTADETGDITVTEVPLPPPSEREQAVSDIQETAQAALDRMDQIVTQTQAIIDTASPTNAQVVAGVKQLAAQVQDEARAIKRLIRYLRTGT